MIKIHRKKLWQGSFDVRDYEYEEAKRNGQNLLLVCSEKPDEVMKVTLEEFDKKKWTTGKNHHANFPLPNGKKTYKLLSIKWVGEKVKSFN